MIRLLAVLWTVVRTPSPTGWAVGLLGLACWLASELTQLVELRIIALMCLLVLVLAIPWLLVPMRVRAKVSLRPPRSMAGEETEVQLAATNEGRLSLWRPLVSIPITGSATATVLWDRMPTMSPGKVERLVTTSEPLPRGVHLVGPASSLRSDPLGLVRRTVRWAEPVELYVRPRMVILQTLGRGEVRDLEGSPSDRMSMSDLAFHALREYVPGDDLRHVHWRSSARAGELLVRQYHDTRRNHATVVLDADPASWGAGEPGDTTYELGVSVAASLVMCAAREEYDVSLVSGVEQSHGLPPNAVLDATCRVQRLAGQEGGLAQEVTRALVVAPETSILFVVTGLGNDLDAVAASMAQVPAETRAVVVRVVPGEEATAATTYGYELLTLGALPQLPNLVAGSA